MRKPVTCPSCGQTVSMPADLVGRGLRCPNCQAIIPAGVEGRSASRQPASFTPPPLPAQPQPPGAARAPARSRPQAARVATCPQCTKAFGVRPGAGAQRVGCPHCRAELLVQEDGGGLRAVLAPLEPASLPGGPLEPASLDLNAGWAGQPAAASLGLRAGSSATAAATEVDPLAFLGLGAAGGAPAATPRKGPDSRYRAAKSGQAAATHDCVIGCFTCDQDPSAGREVVEAMCKILRKEESFASVGVSRDQDQWGRKVTVDEGVVSVLGVPGGFLKKASCAISTQATIVLPNGRQESTSASGRQQQGSLDAMRKALVKSCAKTMAAATLKAATGYKHLAQDISTMATCCLVFGILSWIPGIGFLFFAIAAILGLVALVFNAGRARKIGTRRLIFGMVSGAIAVLVWIIVFSTSRF